MEVIKLVLFCSQSSRIYKITAYSLSVFITPQIFIPCDCLLPVSRVGIHFMQQLILLLIDPGLFVLILKVR